MYFNFSVEIEMANANEQNRELQNSLEYVQEDFQNKIESIIEHMQNNKITNTKPITTPDEMKVKHEKYLEHLLNQLKQELPSNHVELDIEEMQCNVVSKLQEAVKDLENMIAIEEKEIEKYKADIK